MEKVEVLRSSLNNHVNGIAHQNKLYPQYFDLSTANYDPIATRLVDLPKIRVSFGKAEPLRYFRKTRDFFFLDNLKKRRNVLKSDHLILECDH